MKYILFLFLFFTFTADAQFAWKFQDRLFEPGETVTADCWVSGFDSIGAFQFSLAYDSAALKIDLDTPFVFTGLIPWTAAEFSHGLQPGCASAANEIRLVWADPYTFTYANGKAFSIRFTAKTAGSVCKSIWMLNGPMWPEAWDDNLLNAVPMTVGCIPLRRPTMKQREQETLAFAAYPNPTAGLITVTLPTSGRITVFDALGRVESEMEGVEGANEITLTGANGIKAIEFQGTIKMVVKQ